MAAPPDLVAFCTQEHPRLVGAMAIYTGDHLLAEEIAQEALVRACERWSSVSEMPAPGAWAHRVAMNLAKSRFRRRSLERRVAERAAHAPSVDSEVSDDSLAIRDAIRQLPPRQREAVVLRHYVGLSIDEAADVMKVTSSALKSLTHRATLTLEATLSGSNEEVDHAH